MALNVSPTLFIGVGTNGWNILDNLRELVYEEFGVSGLECFRYVALESDENKRSPDNIPGTLVHEIVTPVLIGVPTTDTAKRRINPGDHDHYTPGLAAWLDPLLVNRGARNFTAGAGNSRHAGRLCLWENWDGKACKAITDAYQDITNQKKRDEADKFLREKYLPKKGISNVSDPIVGLAPKVYIFGTLCGGTCSGSFIDLAYFVSDLIGVGARSMVSQPTSPEVIGLFTIIDTLTVNERHLRTNVANCSAALRELDYYYQENSSYRVEFPDGKVINTTNQPFDTLYLVSMRNMQKLGFPESDIPALTKMCAMNLFTEVVAGMAAVKSANRVNLRNTAQGYLKPNQAGHIQAFSCFGLSAISYPRYRIAQAINRQLGKDMCDHWLGGDLNASVVKDEAKSEWLNLLEQGKRSLVGAGEVLLGAGEVKPRCGVDLMNEVSVTFDHGQSQFEATDKSALDGFASYFPDPKATFVDKLARPQGEYFQKIFDSRELVLKDIKHALQHLIESYISAHTIRETKQYVGHILTQVDNLLKEHSDEIPVLSQKLDLRLSNEVHSDFWSRLLYLRRQAIIEYKAALWQDLRYRVEAQLESVRDAALKSILPGVIEYLKEASDQIQSIEDTLAELRKACITQKANRINLTQHNNLVVISDGKIDNIEDDVNTAVSNILRETERIELRRMFLGGDSAISSLFDADISLLVSRTDTAFGAKSREAVSHFQIGQEILKKLANRIEALVVTSLPYIEPESTWKPLATAQLPNFLFSQDQQSGKDLVAKTTKTLTDQRAHYAWASSPLDHFVFFYQERPGLAVSDLAVYTKAESVLSEVEASSSKIATCYTHKAGQRHFNVGRVREYAELTRWIGAMSYLRPDVFYPDGNNRKFLKFTTLDGMNRTLCVDDHDQLKSHVDEHSNKVLLTLFKQKVKEQGKEKTIERMNQISDGVTDPSKKRDLEQLHDSIVQVVFSDGGGCG